MVSKQLLHVERGLDLDAHPRRALAAVREAVHAAGGDDDGLARAGDDPPQAEAERHRALEHVEALLLLGVHVRAGHVPVLRQLQLELEQAAVRVG